MPELGKRVCPRHGATGQVSVANSGTLGGTGTVFSAISVFPGSTLAPGSNAIGILTVTNGVTLTGGTLRVIIATTNSGIYGQVQVTGGNVTLTNATLAVSGSGYTPSVSLFYGSGSNHLSVYNTAHYDAD